MIIVRNPLDLTEMLHMGDTWVEFTPSNAYTPWRLCPACVPAMFNREFSRMTSQRQIPYVARGAETPASFGPYYHRHVSCDGCRLMDGGGTVRHAQLIPYA